LRYLKSACGTFLRIVCSCL